MCTTPHPYAKQLNIATVGDTDSQQMFAVNQVLWDANGTLLVTLAETAGEVAKTKELARNDVERARRLARRCLLRPEKTRSSRLVSESYENGSLHMTFAVSRVE